MGIEIDISKVQDLAPKMSKAAEQLVRQVTLAVEGESLKVVPKATDNLMSTINSRFEGSGAALTGIVSAPAKTADGKPYGLFVHEGTGLYGPEKRPIIIVPKNKKALTIPASALGGVRMGAIGSGAVLLRRRAVVKGMKARPFFKWAWETVSTKVPEIARSIIAEVFAHGDAAGGRP